MRARHLFLAAALAGSLAACGGDAGGDGGYGTAGETTADETTAEETTAEEGDDAAETAGALMVADSDLGEILVDGEGMTVYLFTNDSPGVSTCEGDCLAAWPPLAGPVEAGDGVDASLLGTTTATDGSTQATYDGWPLYYWQQDAAPGDVTGQGVNDVWYVVAPDGTMVTEAPMSNAADY
jgi:predicted lipoprotein with Yx(FWY)xxD motif